MRKTFSRSLTSNLESGKLQDMLRAQKTKKVSIRHKGKMYGITDLVTDSGQAILLADEGATGISADYLVKQLADTLGQDIFVEIDGKIYPAHTFSGGAVQAAKPSLLSTALSCFSSILKPNPAPAPEAQQIKSFFTGKAGKHSYFHAKDPSFNGMPVLVGPAGLNNFNDKNKVTQGYIAYDTKNDVLQMGLVDDAMSPKLLKNGKLRDLNDFLLALANKHRVSIDTVDEELFGEFTKKNTQRAQSLLNASEEYELVEDKPSGNTILTVGELKGRQVVLITHPHVVEVQKVELNWGGTDHAGDYYEYVGIKDVANAVKQYTGLSLNKADRNLEKFIKLYGLKPSDLS